MRDINIIEPKQHWIFGIERFNPYGSLYTHTHDTVGSVWITSLYQTVGTYFNLEGCDFSCNEVVVEIISFYITTYPDTHNAPLL